MLSIDCNRPEVRKVLIERYNNYNAMFGEKEGIKGLNAYDQITEESRGDEYQYIGLYNFSDGNTLKIRDKEYKNSLGGFVYFFKPMK